MSKRFAVCTIVAALTLWSTSVRAAPPPADDWGDLGLGADETTGTATPATEPAADAPAASPAANAEVTTVAPSDTPEDGVAATATPEPTQAAAEPDPRNDPEFAPHSPSTVDASMLTETNWRPWLGFNGSTGLLRISSAKLGRPGLLRVGFLGEYTTATDWPVAPSSEESASGVSFTNTRAAGRFALNYALIEQLELFGAVAFSSNRNDSGSNTPMLITLGDLSLGAKAAVAATDWLSLGVQLRLGVFPGIGADADLGLGYEPLALVTIDLRRSMPLIAHLNGGLRNDDQKRASKDQPTNPLVALGLGTDRGSHVLLGAGIEAPLPWVTPFAELNWSQSVMFDENLTFANTGDIVKDGSDSTTATLSIGARLTAIRDFTFLAACEFNLLGSTDKLVNEIAPVPAWNLLVGANLAFDPVHAGEVRFVEKITVQEKIVEKMVEVPVEAKPAEPATGLIEGTITDAATQLPLHGALLTIEGSDLPPVASDAKTGAFRSYPLNPGTVKVTLSRPGYKTIQVEAPIEAGGTAQLKAALERDSADTQVHLSLTSEGKPVGGKVTISGAKAAEATVGAGGSGQITLPPGRYTARVEGTGMLAQAKEFQVDDPTGKTAVSVAFDLAKSPKSPLATLSKDRIRIRQQVRFASNQAVILPASNALLDQVVDIILRNDLKKVRVDGHTDNVGAPAQNKALSEARAKAVADYLVAHGVAASRIVSQGYGDSLPIAPNLTERGREMNRRVEFVVTER